MRRVVITGMGMVSPLGNTVADTWNAILNGESGVDTISAFDADAFTTQFSAPVRNLATDHYLPPKDSRKMDAFIQYGMVAGIQAMQDANVEVSDAVAARFGAVIGSGIGGIGMIEKGTMTLENFGPRRLSPFFVPGSITNMISGNLSIKYGLRGPNLAVATACTTGTHAIGLAARSIRYDEADLMLAGGAEMATTPLCLGGFAAARALSTRNDSPKEASRPWDQDRDGFVLGDGAGILVLEEYEHAKARNANIYAELVGFGMSGDAYHMTAPSVGGVGAASAMNNALKDAGLPVSDVQYINAHGTSTIAGDIAECEAIQSVFGRFSSGLAVSSTKSMIGHLLGAAGAVEAVFSVLSIRDQVAPPTINLEKPEERCNLNLVPHTAQTMKINNVVSNSFGFGGTNASLVFSRVP